MGGTISNLGNITVALKFANFAFEEYGLLLGYGAELGLPTGESAKGIGSDHIWEFEPFLNLGWTRDRIDLVGWARFGIPINQDAGEETETELHYDVSGLYRVSARVQALVEVNGQTGLSGPEAGTGVVSLSPGLKVAPLEGRPLFVGVAGSFPIDDEELEARLRVSLFYHF